MINRRKQMPKDYSFGRIGSNAGEIRKEQRQTNKQTSRAIESLKFQ